MRVLLTGGSGYIGSAVARDLLDAGHEVLALARSKSSRDRVEAIGCTAIAGAMDDAAAWLPPADDVDGVVHAAATFDADMAATEAAFLDAVVYWAAGRLAPMLFVYTGGCWLYGAVGDRTAVEGSPFDPLAEFAFMVAHRARLVAEPVLSARVVHPAMVWDEDGGSLSGFLDSAAGGEAPVVAESLSTRWPLVHRADLARLYRLALERGEGGADYHGVGERGVRVGDVAAVIARRHGAPAPVVRSVEDTVSALGGWAAGFALDQTMDAPRSREALGWTPEQPGALEVFGDA